MKNPLITLAAIAASISFSSNAFAVAPDVLDTGDRLNVEFTGGLMVHEARAALRDHGYTAFSKGELFGHTITITATAPDHDIYRLKINNQTGVLKEVYRVRHVF